MLRWAPFVWLLTSHRGLIPEPSTSTVAHVQTVPARDVARVAVDLTDTELERLGDLEQEAVAASVRDRFADHFGPAFSSELPQDLPGLENLRWFESESGVGFLADMILLDSVPAEVLLHVVDLGEDGAKLVVGIRPESISLGDLSADAGLDVTLPGLVFVTSPGTHSLTLSAESQGPVVRDFYRGLLGDDFELTLGPGMNFLAALPLSFLPEIAGSILGVDRDAAVLAQGIIEGSLLAPERFLVNAPVPIRGPPRSRFPDWLGSPTVRALRLQLDGSRRDVTARLYVDLEARLNGATRVFEGISMMPLGLRATTLDLNLYAKESWREPFGIEGLELDNMAATVRFGAAGIGTTVSGVFEVPGRAVNVELSLDPAGNASLYSLMDSAGLEDIKVLAGRLGLGALAEEITFPAGIRQLDDVRFAYFPGDGIAVSGRTVINRELDGPRSFDVEAMITLGGGNTNVALRGTLRGEWPNPYGLDWLVLSDVRLELDSAGEVSVQADMLAGDDQLGVEIETSGRGARFTASADRFSFDQLSALLAQALKVNPLAALEDTAFAHEAFGKLIVQIEVGDRNGITIGADSHLKGRDAAFLLSAALGGGPAQTLVGFRFDKLRLGELMPILDGTLADELEFTKAAVLLASANGRLQGERLGRAEREFYEGLMPATGPGGFEVSFASGLSFVGALPVDEDSFLHGPLGVVGSPQEQLFVAGTLPNVFADSGSGALNLAASLPPMRPSFGSTGDPPPWFRYGQLAFVIRLPTSGQITDLQVGLDGRLGVYVDDQNMEFIVGGAFGGSPPAITLRGGMIADWPWEQPFGVGWLTLTKVGAQIGVNPEGLDLGFTGHTDIGSKNFGVDVLLGISAAGVPNNFAFMGTSTSNLGMADLLTLQNQMAAAAMATGAIDVAPDLSGLLAGLPQLEIQPVDRDTPLEARFALLPYESDLIDIRQGMALNGALFGALSSDQEMVALAQTRSSIGFSGIDSESSINQDIVVSGLALGDAYLKLDVDSFPPAASLVATGDLETPWFDRRIDVAIGGEAKIADALLRVARIINAVSTFTSELGSRPLEALKHAVADSAGMFAIAGVAPPAWMEDVFDGVEGLRRTSPGVSPRDLLDDVLKGRSITVPSGEGFPRGGRPPRSCENLTHAVYAGRCWSRKPVEGVPLPRVEQCITGGGVKLVSGVCYTVPPGTKSNLPRLKRCETVLGKRRCLDLGCPPGHGERRGRCEADIPAMRAPDPKPRDICFGIESSGGCWMVGFAPREGEPSGGLDPVCPITQQFYLDGKCWTIPPTPEVQTGELPGLCRAIGISCGDDVIAHLGDVLVNMLKDTADGLTKPFEAK